MAKLFFFLIIIFLFTVKIWVIVMLREKKTTTGYKTIYGSQNLFKNFPIPTILPVRTYNKMLIVVISWGGSSRRQRWESKAN